MKYRSTFLCAALLIAVNVSVALAQPAGQSRPSPDEQKALQAIMAAADPGQKMKAVAYFIKKYPKSPARARLAHAVADQSAAVKDPAQKITLAQSYQQTFPDPSEQDLIVPILI